ncbi:hypothetical protein ACQCVP_01155 [Rossellomorea vietnamensis]
MFSREKKAIFPFILLRLFDPEGLGAGTRLGSHLSSKVEAPWSALTGKCSQEKKRWSSFLSLGVI